LHLHLGLDDFFKGGYIRVNSPLTHTRWKLNMTEYIKDFGVTPFEAGYMGPESINRDILPMSFSQVMLGMAIPKTPEYTTNPKPITFGDMQTPMCYGKMPVCPLTQTRLADIQITLGWNLERENGHFGLFIDGVLPTGTRPNACYFFEPIIGNGKYYEIGGGISLSWIFWRSKICDDKYLGFWLDATINHMFRACQKRSFDFCGKPNSRYMLIEEFGDADGKLEYQSDGGFQDAAYQYKSNLIPAINISTFTVESEIKLQADVVFKFGYVRDNWSLDIGYNFWARDGECFKCISQNNDDRKFALKGNALLYGQAVGSLNPPIIESPIALSNTNSNATINSVGTLDSPTEGFYDIGPVNAPLYPIAPLAPPLAPQLEISEEPIFVKREDLNICKSPSAMTHKVFLHFSYAWKDRCEERWLPFIGLGGSVEFEHDYCRDCCGYCNNYFRNNTSNTSDNNESTACNFNNCDTCKKRTGVSQWGAWVKGGVSFD